MSHAVQTIAYTGETPWHGLGHQLPKKQPIEVWAEKAGMNWTICSSPVRFMTEQAGALGSIHSYDAMRVLYRSDSRVPLAVVSDRYKIVQPSEIISWFRDLSEVSGFEIETAGCLKEGRKFWALARTGKETVLKGTDTVKSYVLLASSCDGTLSTVAVPTSVRVACANTLSIALNGASSAIKVPHSTTFDGQDIKRQLGIAVSQFDSFMYRMKALAERRVKSHESMQFFLKVLCEREGHTNVAGMVNERALKKVQALYEGQGRGAELAAAKGTAWGLLNAVTEFVDHERRARSPANRLDSAWFGAGADLKQRALEQAMHLVS